MVKEVNIEDIVEGEEYIIETKHGSDMVELSMLDGWELIGSHGYQSWTKEGLTLCGYKVYGPIRLEGVNND